MLQRHVKTLITLLIASALTACGGGGASSLPTMQATSVAPAAAQQQGDLLTTSSITRAAAAASTAIDAGGAASGNWIADTGYSGGAIALSNSTVDTSHVSSPAPQSVYHSMRYGATLSYTISNLTANGAYSIRLHFVESFFKAAGKRVFSVKINGVQFLTNFDIFAEAGGSNIAIVKQVSSNADASGKITIAFASSVNNASIAGIEVVSASVAPAPPANVSVTAINAGGGATGSWIADTDYNGGWLTSVPQSIDASHVSAPAPQSVYQTQRLWTNLAYTIPNLTPNGAYTVRLHFAETWFSSSGQRVFNVSLNGTQVLTNFDMFQAAGGENIALVKQFSANADSSGKISIRFDATKDNAALAGIEILAGSSTSGPKPILTATPAPAPTAAPSSRPVGTATCVQSQTLPIYSGCFTGNTPFHHTFAQLLAAGATNQGQTVANHYLAQGIMPTNPGPDGYASGLPIYFATNSDPGYNMTCPAYGTCNAATSLTGKQIHTPAGDKASQDNDHHLTIVDESSQQEVDMWGGYYTNPSTPNIGNNQCEVGTQTAGEITCSWGGVFPLSGGGLAASQGMSGVAGGYAIGIFTISAGELMQGHIDHALGLQGACLDSNTVYPSNHAGTDSSCNGSADEAEPNAVYGDLIHLKSSVKISNLGYSHYCQVILQALQTYGAYIYDTNRNEGGGNHFSMDVHGTSSYPWFSTIFPSMQAGGDVSSGGNFDYCLQRLTGSDIEVYNISRALPPK